jgi:hypothetical protein
MKEGTVLTDDLTRAGLKLYNDPCPVSEVNVIGVEPGCEEGFRCSLRKE